MRGKEISQKSPFWGGGQLAGSETDKYSSIFFAFIQARTGFFQKYFQIFYFLFDRTLRA